MTTDNRAMTDSNSGTVCRHCGEGIKFTTTVDISEPVWVEKNGTVFCLKHRSMTSAHGCAPHEPTPVEQPRQMVCPFDSPNSPWFKAHPDYCRRCSGEGAILTGGSSLDVSLNAAQKSICHHCNGTGKDPCFVAASPAEGPRPESASVELALYALIRESTYSRIGYLPSHESIMRDFQWWITHGAEIERSRGTQLLAAQPSPDAPQDMAAMQQQQTQAKVAAIANCKHLRLLCPNCGQMQDNPASPDAAKVEEIARELVKRLNLEDEEEQQIAAILRPYFPEKG